MTIKLVSNQLEGMYAVPMDHPVTCGNPSPWKIAEIRIDVRGMEVTVLIRGDESMWFHADNCVISALPDCQDYVELRQRQKWRDVNAPTIVGAVWVAEEVTKNRLCKVFGKDDDDIPFHETVNWLKQYVPRASESCYYILIGDESYPLEIWQGKTNGHLSDFTCVYVNSTDA